MDPGPVYRRRRRFERPNDARFLTFSCYHRLQLFNNDRIKDTFIEALAAARQQFGFQLFGYVVMPEHVHLLLTPAFPQAPVPAILRRLKSGFAHDVLTRWRALSASILDRVEDAQGQARFWQPGGGYDRNLTSPEAFREKLDYIHQNPVRRGLAGTPTDWLWSSARWYAGERSHDILPLDRPPF